MTDDTPNVDPEGVDVETCLAQLRDPAVILAEALHRVHRADVLSEHMTFNLQRDHLTETAATLAYIAKAAADMAHQERMTGGVFTAEQFDRLEDADMEDRTVPPGDLTRAYEPQAVNGVRFTADLQGQYMGVVGDRAWLYVAGHGFIDITDSTAPSDREGFFYTGRIVSATPDHILGVTDYGKSVTLPRALIVESADE